jgi:hypothetical protein
MNDVQLFLEEMYKNVSKEEMKKMDKTISDALLKKISIMLDNQIITNSDAKEFADRHNLNIDKAKVRKITTKISDGCSGSGVSVDRSSC